MADDDYRTSRNELVLIPGGWSCNAELYTKLAIYLTRFGFDVLTMSPRGVPPNNNVSSIPAAYIEDCASDWLALLEKINGRWQSYAKLHLLPHSQGTQVAMALLSKLREKGVEVSSIVLNAPLLCLPAKPKSDSLILKIHGFFVRAIDWLGERLGARNWLRRACAIAGYAIAAALDFVYYSFKRDDKGERLLAAREAHSKFWKNVILLDASTSLLSLDAMKFAHERTLQLIRDIDIPTMIVWGKYDTFVEEPTRYLSTHSNPNIQFLELQRGHFLHLESDVFAEKAAQFMAKQVACTSK